MIYILGIWTLQFLVTHNIQVTSDDMSGFKVNIEEQQPHVLSESVNVNTLQFYPVVEEFSCHQSSAGAFNWKGSTGLWNSLVF